MTTPDTKNGITKDSTLQVNVNPYFPNNYKQTLNYVGYWKWDSTNQTFIQVLNNQDIIDEKYNLKIQPLFYDADTGLPQKVTVNSGYTKRLKMVNDNNDGAMEPAEYVENNSMVRFNSKTRSVTEYPYFEVEALPPTISSPITSNGYYKFDENKLIPGTNLDYNIRVNISTEKPTIKYLGVSEINNSYYIEINLNSFTRSTGNYNYYAKDVVLVFGLDVGRFFFGYSNGNGTNNYGHHCLWYNISSAVNATPQIVKFLDSNKIELFRTVIQSDQGFSVDRCLAYLNNSFNINCGNTTYNNYWKNNTG